MVNAAKDVITKNKLQKILNIRTINTNNRIIRHSRHKLQITGDNATEKNTPNMNRRRAKEKPLICHESAIDKWQHANRRQY